jgi:hypothetical protein
MRAFDKGDDGLDRIPSSDLICHWLGSVRDPNGRLTGGGSCLAWNTSLASVRVLARRESARREPPPLDLAGTSASHRVPHLQRVPARLLGIGIRPEHVRAPIWSDPGRG